MALRLNFPLGPQPLTQARPNRVKDGPSCQGCGLPNYEGICPHCRGDAEGYERVFVPPFESLRQSAERIGGEEA